MASEGARPRAPPFIDPPGYARHRPEATLLYQIIERHYPEFVTAREATGRPLQLQASRLRSGPSDPSRAELAGAARALADDVSPKL